MERDPSIYSPAWEDISLDDLHQLVNENKASQAVKLAQLRVGKLRETLTETRAALVDTYRALPQEDWETLGDEVAKEIIKLETFIGNQEHGTD